MKIYQAYIIIETSAAGEDGQKINQIIVNTHIISRIIQAYIIGISAAI